MSDIFLPNKITPQIVNDPDDPTVLYRVTAVHTTRGQGCGIDTDLYFDTFKIISETKCGKWIRDHNGRKRFVLNKARKKFAHMTKLEALQSFIFRKWAQYRILQAQSEIVLRSANVAEQIFSDTRKRAGFPALFIAKYWFNAFGMKWVYDRKSEEGKFLDGGPSDQPFHELLNELIGCGLATEADMLPANTIHSTTEPLCYPVSYRRHNGFPDDCNKHDPSCFDWLRNSPAFQSIISGQTLLLIHDMWEGVPFKQIHPTDVIATHLGISPNHIVFADGDVSTPQPGLTHVIPMNFFETHITQMVWWKSNMHHSTQKPKRFLSYARHWNTSRQYTTLELYARGLLPHGLVSCSTAETPVNAIKFAQIVKERWLYLDTQSHVEKILSAVPSFLDILPLHIDTNLRYNLYQTFPLQHYLDTDFSIVNETYTGVDTIFLSEKTWKAIAAKHPFVVFGNPGTLKWLQTQGFQTFHPLFDETYDQVDDLCTRKNLILNQVERYCLLPDHERLKILHGLNEIAEFNYKHWLTRQQPFATLLEAVRAISDRNNFGKMYK